MVIATLFLASTYLVGGSCGPFADEWPRRKSGSNQGRLTPLIAQIATELHSLESRDLSPAQVARKCPALWGVIKSRFPAESENSERFYALLISELKKAIHRCSDAERDSLLRLLRLSADASTLADVNRSYAIRRLRLGVDAHTFRRPNYRPALDLYGRAARLLLRDPDTTNDIEFINRDIQHRVGPDGVLIESRYIETIRSLVDGLNRCSFFTEYPNDESPEVITIEPVRGCDIGEDFLPPYPNRSLVRGSFSVPRLPLGRRHTFEYVVRFNTVVPTRQHIWESEASGTTTSTVAVEFSPSTEPCLGWAFDNIPVPLAIPSQPCDMKLKPFKGRLQYTFYEPQALYGIAWRF